MSPLSLRRVPQGRADVACMVARRGCAAFGRAFLRAAGTNPPTQTNGERVSPVRKRDL